MSVSATNAPGYVGKFPGPEVGKGHEADKGEGPKSKLDGLTSLLSLVSPLLGDSWSSSLGAPESARVQEQSTRMGGGSVETFSWISRDAVAEKVSAPLIEAVNESAKLGRLPMPAAVAYVDSDVMQGVQAAYAPGGGGTVYLDRALRDDPAGRDAALGQVYGHHLDALVGGADGPDAGGRLLAAMMAGGGRLTETERAAAVAAPERGEIEVDGESVEVAFASPPVLDWLARSARGPVPQASLDAVQTQLAGAPTAGRAAAADARIDLVPGTGHGALAPKLAKLEEAVTRLADDTRLAEKVPGELTGRAEALSREVHTRFERFSDSVSAGQFDRARPQWAATVGALRTVQVAGALADRGAEIVGLGHAVPQPDGRGRAEFDVVFREHGRTYAAEVHAGAGGTQAVRDAARADAAAAAIGAEYRVLGG